MGGAVMRGALLTAALVLGFAGNAAAMAIDVSDDTIRVTTGFTGAGITVFGAQEKAGNVIIVVEGPPKTIKVSKKSRVLGMWTNTDSREYKNIPAFYEVAASGPLTVAAQPEVLRAKRIGLDNLSIVPARKADDPDSPAFTKALIEMQQRSHLFVQDIAPLTYPGPQLFKARFNVPATVPPGTYTVSAYLFENGQVVEQDSGSFVVVPEGLSADLRRFATQNGLLYGLCGVLMAMLAGWLATVLLKRD